MLSLKRIRTALTLSTSENKSYCTVSSRLRRGILYSKAIQLNCNKIVLGHADDAIETLLLNIHDSQMKNTCKVPKQAG